MMVDAVGEPHFLEVFLELLETRIFPIAGISLIDGFQRTADPQVVTPVLVEQNVAPAQSGLTQVIDQQLLVQGKRIEPRNPVFQHPDVVEAVRHPIEFFFGYLFPASPDARNKYRHK